MKKAAILLCLVLYSGLWVYNKDKIVWSDYYLSPAMPASVTKIYSGFGKKVAGFSLFIKTSIFTGGSLTEVAEENYADSLVQNFDVMTQLYPEFIDPYHYCQAFVPHISTDHARKTNNILERAVSEYPNSLLYPFFRGFNFFKYLNEPLEAARVFMDASELPDAPPLFKSLGGKLMGQGGHLTAGRDMLRIMYKSEENEIVRERYEKELNNFDEAILVQELLDKYKNQNGKNAESLRLLIPDYLSNLPKLEFGYYLDWQPPVLRLLPPGS